MSDAVTIFHMITPLKHTSPFDVNMAVDAGFTTIATYTDVQLKDVAPLTQDAMFSRSPDCAKRTVLFIGGKDASLALDQMKAAADALFPPFEISLFADPSGAFTTAAAMIAQVEKHLKGKRKEGLKGAKVQVYGATGIIGGIAAVIAAEAGADVTIVSHLVIEDVEAKAVDFKKRFGVKLNCAVGQGRRREEGAGRGRRGDPDLRLSRDRGDLHPCAGSGQKPARRRRHQRSAPERHRGRRLERRRRGAAARRRDRRADDRPGQVPGAAPDAEAHPDVRHRAADRLQRGV